MTRYELGERIGVGGMAEIFRGTAVAAGGFEKPVAIKRILPHLSQDQRFVKLLISEAKLLSQLRHRNIVQIFDVGLGEDGQFFLVMEYVDGADLGNLYEKLEDARKRLPLELSVHIVAEVCDALEYAHRARGADDEPLNIVHRDVSPANILLSRSGEVKLTDFGIAKHAEEHTGHGGVRGKFAYIAPEQAVNQHVDPRSDVYSAGVCLYELVLGHRLFSGMPDFDALRAVREAKITRPRVIDSQVSPELEAILMTALAKNPDDRFPSAGKMGSALRSFRYSLAESGADPAAEIARILEKASNQPAGKGRNMAREKTVVRIRTAAGFGMAEFEEFSGTTLGGDVPGNNESRWDFDDDEETQAMEARHLPRPEASTTRNEVVPRDAGPRAGSEFDTSDLEVPSLVPTAGGASNGRQAAAVIAPVQPERAATPTVRDLFHTGALLDDPSISPPSSPVAKLPSDAEVLSAPRRRRIMIMILVAVGVATSSFVVANAVLSRGAAAPGVDAAPAFDAGPPDGGDVEMPPVVVPEKKPTHKKRHRRKKKSHRKR